MVRPSITKNSLPLVFRGYVVEREVQFQHIHPRFAPQAEVALSRVFPDQNPHCVFGDSTLMRDSRNRSFAAAGEISGSRPDVEVVSSSSVPSSRQPYPLDPAFDGRGLRRQAVNSFDQSILEEIEKMK